VTGLNKLARTKHCSLFCRRDKEKSFVTLSPGHTSLPVSTVEGRQRNPDQQQVQQQQLQQPATAAPQQLPTLARTTKSGLLVYSSSDYSLNNNNNNNNNNKFVHSAMTMSAYDESVKSAVHVYEQVTMLLILFCAVIYNFCTITIEIIVYT
jgi:hypothetical protein